ncbi:Ig-like domain-containing protein [Atopobiaceae bacterium 24-176]
MDRLWIQNLSHQDTNRIYYTDRFYLAMTWDATANGGTLRTGDHFDMTIPDQMVFPSDTSARDFDLYGEDGRTVVARAHVDPGTPSGGTVRVTFADWVEGRRNVRGTLFLASRLDTTKITNDQPNVLRATINGQVFPITVDVAGPRDIHNEVLAKWGSPDPQAQPARRAGYLPQASWTVRINHEKQDLSGVRLTDSLGEGTGSETYLPDSFVLRQVEMNARGHVTRVVSTDDLTGKLEFSPDRRSFSLALGDLAGRSYQLTYKTSYSPGTTLRNNAQLFSQERSESRSSTIQTADSGGRGQGDLGGRIKISKVASDNRALGLAGATFEVTRPDGSSFELSTGSDGTILSGILEPGTYRVRETAAPSGYQGSNETFELQVEGDGRVAELTVANDPESADVPVTKVWQGPAAGPVTVRLLADGQDTGQTLVLSEETGWKGSFTGLRKQGADGRAIAYSISEDPVDGYETDVSGNADEGFTVTNTARDVPPPDDPQGPNDPTPQDPKGSTPDGRGRVQGAGHGVTSGKTAPSLVPVLGDGSPSITGGLVLSALAVAGAAVLAWARSR